MGIIIWEQWVLGGGISMATTKTTVPWKSKILLGLFLWPLHSQLVLKRVFKPKISLEVFDRVRKAFRIMFIAVKDLILSRLISDWRMAELNSCEASKEFLPLIAGH